MISLVVPIFPIRLHWLYIWLPWYSSSRTSTASPSATNHGSSAVVVFPCLCKDDPRKNDWDSFRNSQIRVLKMVSMLRPLRLIGKTSSVRLIIEVWRGWVWCRFVCWSAVEAFSECWVSSQWMPPDQIFNLSVFAFGYWISMISINKYHDYILRLFFCLKLKQFSGQFHNEVNPKCNCYWLLLGWPPSGVACSHSNADQHGGAGQSWYPRYSAYCFSGHCRLLMRFYGLLYLTM